MKLKKKRKGRYIIIAWENSRNVQSHKVPPNDAATATEPATVPAAVAAAANPLAPITGIRVPKVGARAPNPAAIAGAAKPVEWLKHSHIQIENDSSGKTKLFHNTVKKKSMFPHHQ